MWVRTRYLVLAPRRENGTVIDQSPYLHPSDAHCRQLPGIFTSYAEYIMEVWKVLAAIQFLVLSLGTQAPGSTHGPLESYQAHNARVQLEKEIQFTVNETEISGAAVWVSVSWDNVRFPSYDDFLALYPDGADPSKTAPIKFKLAIRSITHLLLGSGTASCVVNLCIWRSTRRVPVCCTELGLSSSSSTSWILHKASF